MGKLFFYELKKLFSKKLIPALLLFLFCFNGLMVYRESGQNAEPYYTKKEIGAVYEDLEGMTALEAEVYLGEQIELLEAVDVWRKWADYSEEWTAEEKDYFKKKNQELLEVYPDLDINESYLHYLKDFYAEQKLLSDVYEQVSAVAHYEEYLDGIEEEARIMTSSSLFGTPGTFSYRNIEKTPPVYGHLKGTVLYAEDSEGVLLATESRITDVLLLCLIAVLAVSMLIGEREDGTLLLIKPTKRGYLETITVKVSAMLFLVILGTVLFYGADFLLAQGTLGLGTLDRPIQSVKGFLTSPYKLTVGEYLAGFLAAKVFIAVVYGALLFCLCTVFRNGVSACLSVAAVLLTEFVLYLTIGLHSYLSPLKIINLICMADTAWFFCDYLNMNVFGYPVNVVPVCLGAAVLVLVFSGVFAARRYVKENSVLGSENRMLAAIKKYCRRRKGKIRKIRINLLRKEIYKIFVMEQAWFLLVVFALLQWNFYKEYQVYLDPDEAYYRQYIGWAEGHSLTETAGLYQEEYDRFETLKKEAEKAAKAYAAGELSYGKYDEIRLKVQSASLAENGFYRAVIQYEYVLSQIRSGEQAELFMDSGWEVLLGPNGQRDDVMNAGKLAFFLVIGLSAVFAIEKSTRMELLQHTCLRGRGSVCIRKYLSCLLYGTTAWMIAYLPRYLAVFSQYGTAGLGSPLKSLSILSDVPFNIPLWGYLVLVGICRYLGMVTSVGLILWLSKKTGNMIQTILIALLVLLLPVFLYLMGLTGETYLSLLPMMTGYSMYRMTGGRLLYWLTVLAIGSWFYFQTYEEGGAV